MDAAGFEVDTLHSIANSVDPGYWTKATDGKAKWTAPQMVKTLTDLEVELDTDGILNPGALGIQQYPDANNNFLSGKSAFVQMGTWYRQYADVPGLTAGLQAAGVSSSTAKVPIVPVPFPNVGGSTGALFGDPDYGVSVNKKSKNIAAATTFALWLGATKEGQQVIANNLDEDPVLESVKADLSKVQAGRSRPCSRRISTLSRQLCRRASPSRGWRTSRPVSTRPSRMLHPACSAARPRRRRQRRPSRARPGSKSSATLPPRGRVEIPKPGNHSPPRTDRGILNDTVANAHAMEARQHNEQEPAIRGLRLHRSRRWSSRSA